jgi:hypothetical protein
VDIGLRAFDVDQLAFAQVQKGLLALIEFNVGGQAGSDGVDQVFTHSQLLKFSRSAFVGGWRAIRRSTAAAAAGTPPSPSR